MINIAGFDKIFLYGQPCDMRKGFNGLSGIIQNQMQLHPLNKYLFVFLSKDRNKLKMLHWDKDGLVLYYKRLEKGTFRDPWGEGKRFNSQLFEEELYMILRGIDFDKTKKRKRFLSDNIVD